MSQIASYKSPKQRLVEDARFVSSHRDMLGADYFIHGIEAALLEYQRILGSASSDNFNQYAASHLKLVGAQEFVRVLFDLVETPTPRAPAPTRNLDHRA